MAVVDLYGGAELIRQRLETVITQDVTVVALSTNEAAKRLMKIKPLITVAYLGESGNAEEVMQGTVFKPKQTFSVCLIMPDLRDIVTGERLTTDAGVISLAILNALAGHKLSANYSALQPQAEPRQQFISGYGYYLRNYTTQVKII